MNNQELSAIPKNEFVENVKKWVILDSQLKLVGEKTKEIRHVRNDLSKKICDYMITNNMENKKIGIHDGDIKIYEKKDYNPLTFGYIEDCLGEIIEDKAHVEYILQHLKNSRTIKTSHDLKRSYTAAK
jgi:hypothetical protein